MNGPFGRDQVLDYGDEHEALAGDLAQLAVERHPRTSASRSTLIMTRRGLTANLLVPDTLWTSARWMTRYRRSLLNQAFEKT
jgi:hypothetical protein